MKKPLIGISGSHIIDDHGAFPGYHRSYVNDDYIRSITEAGGVPVILPFNTDEAARNTMDHIDGLLLSGGHDVYPLNYGEEPYQSIGPVWPERDHFDCLLLEAAEKKGLPIMGICRGLQIINVYHKGTLYQDLSLDKKCYIKHSQNQSPETPTHTISIQLDSHLGRIIGRQQHISSPHDIVWITNSHHHQTVHEVGQGLRVTAQAKDGTIEALEGISYPYLVAYQFHPEMMSINDPLAKQLFRDFVQAVERSFYHEHP